MSEIQKKIERRINRIRDEIAGLGIKKYNLGSPSYRVGFLYGMEEALYMLNFAIHNQKCEKRRRG